MTKTISLLIITSALGATLVVGQNPTPLVNKAPAELIAVLQSQASHKDKADACRELAVVGNKDAIPALVSLLADEKLSHMARYALETMPDPASDAALRDALPRLKGRQLAGVITTLSVRRDAKSVAVVARFLTDGEPDVAQAAARALGSIGGSEAVKFLLAALPNVSSQNELAFAEGLFRCAEAELKAGRNSRAVAMYDALRQRPTKLHQVRAGALRGAIVARGKGDTALLRDSIASADYIVFAAAVRASFELPDVEVTRVLIDALPQLSADNQIVVLKSMGRRGDAAALPTLAEIAKTGQKQARLTAIQAMAEIGKPASVQALAAVLGDGDREIAQAAQESLASVPGPEVDQFVMEKLDGSSAADRMTGIELVGRRRMTSAFPALLKSATHTDAQVRRAAFRRLGELAQPAQLPGLLDLLVGAGNSGDLSAAEQTVTAVCARATPPESVAGRITERLGQAQPGNKSALLRVLASIGGSDALRALRSASKDSNTEVRAAAIRSLGSWKTLDAAPDLLDLARNAPDAADRAVALSSYIGLANNSDMPAEPRLAICRQAATLAQRAGDKKLLLGALGSVAAPESIPIIMPYLQDAATKEEASAAAVSVADALLKGPNAAGVAADLIEPLRKAAEMTSNADLSRRAKTVLKQAEAKAGK